MRKFTSTLRHSIKGAWRLAQTGRILSTTGLFWLLGDRPPAPRLLRQTFEKLGTTYIKLGQFIASSPSLFPQAYVEEFQHCLDNTPAIPFAVMERLLKDNLPLPLSSLFASIDPQPLATASIAQVHAARLLDGTDVVIKIQKPNVKDLLHTDLNFLYVGARIIEWLAPNLSMASLSSVIEEIQSSMLAECDFRLEAQNLEEFSQCIERFHLTGVVAPRFYPQACSEKVLTMQRLYGLPFTDLEAVKQHSQNPQQNLLHALNAWMTTLLMGHSFHADLHAGNLLVLTDGRVGFIDFGIVGKIRPQIWGAITQLVQAISSQDFVAMAQAMVTIGVTKDSVDIEALASSIEQLYASFHQLNQVGEVTQADNQINALLMQTVAIGKQHGIHFPREFALLMKQILYFDRYLQLLAPDLDLFSATGLSDLLAANSNPQNQALLSSDPLRQ
jgi:hypothetical protein